MNYQGCEEELTECLVSAIITTYKREPSMVLRSVKSVAGQTYSNIEIIVVDDSPKDFKERDSVRDAVLKYKNDIFPYIKYIRNEQSLGASSARNIGLKHCIGGIVGFLDDDDEWCPDKVAKMISRFDDETVGLVYCYYINCNDITHQVEKIKTPVHTGFVYNSLIQHNFIGSSSIPLVRKENLMQIGGFDPDMQSSQDFDVWLRLANIIKFDIVKEFLAVYHVHAGERISTNVDKKIAGLERINDKNSDYILANKSVYFIRHIKLCPFYSMKGNVKKTFSLWLNCVFVQPLCVDQSFYFLLYSLFCYIKFKLIVRSQSITAPILDD